MGDKEIIASKKMIQTLIGYWLLVGIVLGIIYKVLFYVIYNSVESYVILGICAIILNAIIVFLTWKLSTYCSFKKKTISSDDIPKLMKNVIIFTIIICLFNCIYDYVSISEDLNEVNEKLETYDEYISEYGDYLTEEFLAIYESQREETETMVNQLYTYTVIVEIGYIIIYLGVLPLEKREILKYVS